MKLYAYLHKGIPITEYTIRETPGIPQGTMLWMVNVNNQPTPSGYTDITSIQSWNQMYHKGMLNKDYKFIRQGIKEIVQTTDWDALTIQEKEIASNWFVVDATKRIEVHTLDEQIAQGFYFHRCSIESRTARFNAASVEIYNRLSRSDQAIIMAEVEQSALSHFYIRYGIEGTLEGDMPGLFDYLLGRDNTPWAGSGVLQQNCQPSGITMTQLVDKIMSILVSGLYDYSQFAI